MPVPKAIIKALNNLSQDLLIKQALYNIDNASSIEFDCATDNEKILINIILLAHLQVYTML